MTVGGELENTSCWKKTNKNKKKTREKHIFINDNTYKEKF